MSLALLKLFYISNLYLNYLLSTFISTIHDFSFHGICFLCLQDWWTVYILLVFVFLPCRALDVLIVIAIKFCWADFQAGELLD